MTDELKNFEDNDAWEILNVSNKATIVKCKQVLKKSQVSCQRLHTKGGCVILGGILTNGKTHNFKTFICIGGKRLCFMVVSSNAFHAFVNYNNSVKLS